jgi:hypothetical protein
MLKAQIEQSYAAHPAFRLGRPWCVRDVASMARFARAFDAAQNAAGTTALDEGSSAARAVFADLRTQAEDDALRCFIDELERECVRLINQEFAHFARRRRAAAGPSGSAAAVAEALRRQRHDFGHLGAEAVREMQEIGADTLVLLRQRAAEGRLTRDALSVNSGPMVHALATVLNREFERLGVLEAVSAYAHRPMRVTGLAYELSVPQAQWWRNGLPGLPRAPRTLYAHLDESLAVPKSIVYLSDVGADNGPTSCYPGAYEGLELHPLQDLIGRVVGNVGSAPNSPLHAAYAKGYHQSMTSEAFRCHFMKLPPELRFNSHLGWDVLPDSPAETTLAAREQRLIGPAGSFIVFDGARLLHRGGMLEVGERLALQVMFSEQSLLRRTAKQLRYALAWA